jgi:hypothetical protein
MKHLLVFVTSLFVGILSSKQAYPDGIAFGATTGTAKGVSIGDFRVFDQSVKQFGVDRYGFGDSRLQAGDNLGIHLNSTGGMLLGSMEESGIKPRLGLEYGGRLVANTASKVESYYLWLPALAAGPQIKVVGIEIFPSFRYGASLGNFGKMGLSPDIAFGSYGPGVAINLWFINLGYSRTVTNKKNSIEDFAVQVGKLYYRHEKTNGLKSEYQHIGMYKFDL